MYVLLLETFLRKLRANPVPCGFELPGALIMVKYSANADDVSVLVTNNAEIEEVSKEIEMYEVVSGVKTSREKSVGLSLGSWKGCAFLGPSIGRTICTRYSTSGLVTIFCLS